MSRTIAVVGGYWSTNIGNSFFQLGAEYLLQKVFPHDRVVMLSDQPGYWNVRRGNPANAFILLEQMPLDYLVILGPFLRPEYDRIWLSTLRALHGKGVKIVALGAGMMDYSQQTVVRCRRWLAETPPFIFATRDEETWRNFADLADHAYNGIDLAFFVPDLFEPLTLNMGDYVIFNFDKRPEPRVRILRDRTASPAPDRTVFEFRGQSWEMRFPKLRLALSSKLKLYPYLDAFWPGIYPDRLGDLRIVRTEHRFNPLVLHKAYNSPDSFVSDIPYTYFALYAGAVGTFSDRVHACVAALAYGRWAMLFSQTERARLLERVGLTAITKRPCRLDMERLATEKAGMIDFLESVLRIP